MQILDPSQTLICDQDLRRNVGSGSGSFWRGETGQGLFGRILKQTLVQETYFFQDLVRCRWFGFKICQVSGLNDLFRAMFQKKMVDRPSLSTSLRSKVRRSAKDPHIRPGQETQSTKTRLE